MAINIWILFSIIAAMLLVVFWRRRNAVWGGLTLGIIVGFITAIFFAFKVGGFNLFIVGKFAVVGTLIGFIAELLGKASDHLKRKN